MEQQNLSNNGLADSLGIDPANLTKLVRGQIGNPRPATIHKLTTHGIITKDDIAALRNEPDPREAALAERLKSTGTADRLAAEGITERAIIRLTKRAVGATYDLGTAWDELSQFVNLAIRVQEESRTATNHDGFVDEVLKRAAALSADGEYEASEKTLLDAIAEEKAASNARQSKLLRAASNEALLADNPTAAAGHLWAVVELDLAPDDDRFEYLLALWDHIFTRGTDQGIVLDLKLANALAERMLIAADTDERRCIAQSNLGNSLNTLGHMTGDQTAIRRAITAFEAAVKGSKDTADANAIALFHSNLGMALQNLVPFVDDIDAQLHAAAHAHKTALDFMTDQASATQRGLTHNNLGGVFALIAVRNGDKVMWLNALNAYQTALECFLGTDSAMHIGMALRNVGTATVTLAEIIKDTELFDIALQDFEQSESIFAFDRYPLEWAFTQCGFADLYCARFALSQDALDLDLAQSRIDAARPVLVEKNADLPLARLDRQQAAIDAYRAALTPP